MSATTARDQVLLYGGVTDANHICSIADGQPMALALHGRVRLTSLVCRPRVLCTCSHRSQAELLSTSMIASELTIEADILKPDGPLSSL